MGAAQDVVSHDVKLQGRAGARLEKKCVRVRLVLQGGEHKEAEVQAESSIRRSLGMLLMLSHSSLIEGRSSRILPCCWQNPHVPWEAAQSTLTCCLNDRTHLSAFLP